MEQFLNSIIMFLGFLGLIFLINMFARKKVSTRTGIFALLAIVFIPFGWAWGVTSYYESEPSAAIIGIFVFSGIGLLFALLAGRDHFSHENKNTESKRSTQKLGVKITAITLLAIGIFTLPMTIVLNKTLNTLSDHEKLTNILADDLISDNALPHFVKRVTVYETLYGIFPEKFEERLMMYMVSGIKPGEMVKLLDMTLTEEQRIELLNEGSNAVLEWLQSDNAYPELMIMPRDYLLGAQKNTEEIAKWIYLNIDMPLMADTTISKFEKGIYSQNSMDYFGTPPEHLKDSILVHFSAALETQIATADIPSEINLSEELAKETTAEEMLENKAKLLKTFGMLKLIWIIPVLLILAAFIIVYFSKLKLLPWVAWSILAFACRTILCGSTFSNSIDLVNSKIPELAEQAPAPALALIEVIIPQILNPIGHSMITISWITGFIGIALLGVFYFEKIKNFRFSKLQFQG